MKRLLLPVLILIFALPLAAAQRVKYIMTLELSQSRFSFDADIHVKDAMNKVIFNIAVDEDTYNGITVGGSFWVEGSAGNWQLKCTDKIITQSDEFIQVVQPSALQSDGSTSLKRIVCPQCQKGWHYQCSESMVSVICHHCKVKLAVPKDE